MTKPRAKSFSRSVRNFTYVLALSDQRSLGKPSQHHNFVETCVPIGWMSHSLITHLSLVQKDDLYYISCQEDFYHPEVSNFTPAVEPSGQQRIAIQDFLSLLVPPLVPVVYLLLRTGTIFSNLNASALQLLLGLWMPASNRGRTTTTDGSSDGGSSKEDWQISRTSELPHLSALCLQVVKCK